MTRTIIELTRTQTKILADRIEWFTGQAALNQKQAAEAIGVSVDALRDVLRRRAATRINRVTFDRIASVVGVDASGWSLTVRG